MKLTGLGNSPLNSPKDVKTVDDSPVNLPDSSVNLPDSSENLPDSSVNLPDSSVNLPDSSSSSIQDLSLIEKVKNESSPLKYFKKKNFESKSSSPTNRQGKFIVWDNLNDCVHSSNDVTDAQRPTVAVRRNHLYDESFEKKVLSSPTFHVGSVTVKAEEIGLVVVILLLWAGAITLFINRWGKLRMLEPYQPQFSAPVESPGTAIPQGGPPFINIQSTSSLSLAERTISPEWGKEGGHFTARRSFGRIAGSMTSLYTLNPARKVRSAVDLVSLVMQEKLTTGHHHHQSSYAATNV